MSQPTFAFDYRRESVYCLSNRCFKENIYKIGFSDDPSNRAKQLFTTGVPTPFEIVFLIQGRASAYNIEQKIHEYLEDYRVSKKREFFRISLKSLKQILQEDLKLTLFDEYGDNITCVSSDI